jgi:hypothetical protein
MLTLILRKYCEYNCDLLHKHHHYAQEGIFGVGKQASQVGGRWENQHAPMLTRSGLILISEIDLKFTTENTLSSKIGCNEKMGTKICHM